MNRFEQLVFNLLFNSLLSYFAALLVVLAIIKIFRVTNPSFRLYLYSLPFLKLGLDLVRGIPPDSYIFSNLNFLALPADLQGYLSASLGFGFIGPLISLRLGIAPAGDSGNTLFSVSAVDVIYTWLHTNVGFHYASVLIALSVCVSIVLLIHRIGNWVSFERKRRIDRKESVTVDKLAFGRRSVDVYKSSTYVGTPFTGGVIFPYICFPEQTFAVLSASERSAVIYHELAHIKHFDIVQSFLIQLLGDVFWFVPFYGWLKSRVERYRELVADRTAAATDGQRAALATALIKLQEMKFHPPKAALYSALSKHQASLRERIVQLSAEPPRLTWLRKSIYVVSGLWAAGAVLSTTFGDNYQLEKSSDLSQRLSERVEAMFSGE